MAGKIINNAGEVALVVSDITTTEVRIRVVDCRSNKKIEKARVKKIIISNGVKSFTKEFSRNEKPLEGNDITKKSMIALQRFGYEKDPKTNKSINTAENLLPKKYNAAWVGYYNAYWKDRVVDFEDLSSTETPPETKLRYIIDEYTYHYQTTDGNNSFLRVQIPTPMLNGHSVEIQVGFWDFPVVLERLKSSTATEGILRASETQNGTNFHVKWKGKQDANWGGKFGWELSGQREMSSSRILTPAYTVLDRAELKVSETIQIVNRANPFTEFDKQTLSEFYNFLFNDSPHFVLLAMQWCQPVWDGIDDPDPGRGQRRNDKVFVNKKDSEGNWIRGLNMHIVTKYSSGSINPHGHYYGFYESKNKQHRDRNAPYRHQGNDFFGGFNGNCPAFAIHRGYITSPQGKGDNGEGYYLRLYLNGEEKGSRCYYMHLAKQPIDKQYVMAGQIIGYCGRTGFSSENPSHLHFDFRDEKGNAQAFSGIGKYFDNIGAYINLFQENKYSLMLPCACEYGNDISDSENAIGCNFSKKGIVSQCWAVQEFPYTNILLNKSSHNTVMHQPDDLRNNQVVKFICPHIFNSSNSNKIAQLQAKLIYLFENPMEVTNGEASIASKLSSSRIEDQTSNGITGNIGPLTHDRIKNVIEAYQLLLPESDVRRSEEILISDKKMPAKGKEEAKTINAHTKLFLGMYEKNGTLSENSLVNDTYIWFSELNFQ